MRLHVSGLIVSTLAFGSACASNTPASGAAPLTEYICSGRSSVGDVRERVNAASRDEAVAKFKEKHADIPVASCTPNPRQ